MALHLKSTGIDFTDFGDASETSELLDDYEEGTWVAGLFGNSAVEISLSTATGQYHKWGAMVRVICKTVATNLNSAAGHMYCAGFPVASRSQGAPGWANGGLVTLGDSMNITASETITMANEPGASHAYFYYGSSVGVSALAPAGMSADGTLRFNVMYFTA